MTIIIIIALAGNKEERLFYRAYRKYKDRFRKKPEPPLAPKAAARKRLIECVRNNGVFNENKWEPLFSIDLEYTLPGGVEDHQEGCSVLVPSQVFHEVVSPPIVTATEPFIQQPDPSTLASTFYTLMMVDPDARLRTVESYSNSLTLHNWHYRTAPRLHWLVSNHQHYDSDGDGLGDFRVGEVVEPYLHPRPAKGTGMHRYVFLLFQHIGKRHFAPPNHTQVTDFNAMHFAQEHNLGALVAANAFHVIEGS
jgi:hypothetical protein